jgi:N-acetylglucosamine malate deacetylase 1
MNILVIAAHPDDEVLGCGGAIRRHADSGDTVNILFVCDGVGARKNVVNAKELQTRRDAALRAAKILGAATPQFLDFPDNRLDTTPLLNVVQAIEAVIEKVKPHTIYSHHAGDLNIDHALVSQAVLTACRPVEGTQIRRILNFEIPSSTEWASPRPETAFIPNFFIDIGPQLDQKLEALGAYSEEMRSFPHPRSEKAIRSLAYWRGANAGLAAAEAFSVTRIIDANYATQPKTAS